MQVKVLTLADAAEWDAYLERLPGADVYHTAGYHAAHQANGDGIALCWVAEHHEALFFYPYMVRAIGDTDLCDIETVYGYSGPLSNCLDGPFLAKTSECFLETCRISKVVAEFTRFNPLSANHRMVALCADGGFYRDRETVVIDLSGDLMAGYSQTARNKIRKAEKAGLAWKYDPAYTNAAWACFEMAYHETMDRNGAASYYHFSHGYFQALRQGLGSKCKLFAAVDGNYSAGSILIIMHGDRMHYHLTGNEEDYIGSGVNNLLLHEAALWGQKHGYRWLHLGGGRTNAPDDPLLRFKASMSRERRQFYVGKRIHNPEAYRQLCDEWKRAHPGQDGGGYFLLWRKP